MQVPKWADELYSKFRANIAQQFLLHGNIDDYICCENNKYLTISNFLPLFLQSWVKKWDIVVFYNCSSGLRFADGNDPNPKMRDTFYSALGRPKAEDVARQFNVLAAQPSNGESREPRIILPLLERMLENKDLHTAVIIEYAESLAPNGDLSMLLPEKIECKETFQRWAFSRKINVAENMIILLCEKLFDLHADIRSLTNKTEIMELPFPTMQERQNFMEFFLSFRHQGVQIEDFPIAKITTGFNYLLLEDLWLRASESHLPIVSEMIKERKKEIQKAESSDLLAIVEPDEGFDDIGGLQSIKEEFQEIAKRMREQDHTLPSGILLLGPPGTGKSVLAKALAKAVDIPLVQFLDVQEKWVGSSERNMRRALESIKRYDQAIVFMDEFDQAYGGRGGTGDSGVTSRLFGALLEIMGDPKNCGKILWLGATNRPDRIDPAMKRPGRFSRQFLLFPPNSHDREEIFHVMYDRRLKIKHSIADFSQAVAKTEGYTGAEIGEICDRSKDYASVAGRETVSQEDLMLALDDFIPANDPSYELMTLLAVRACNSKRQIPQQYCEMTAEEIDQKILQLKAQLGMISPSVWGN